MWRVLVVLAVGKSARADRSFPSSAEVTDGGNLPPFRYRVLHN
jgi:hypothetical protein